MSQSLSLESTQSMTRSQPNAVILFARNPVPGQVKTRLQAELSADVVCALYRAFLLDAKKQLQALTQADGTVAVDAGHDAEFFDTFREAGFQVIQQVGADLGERMRAAFSVKFREGYEKVVIIGSDSPTLPVACIERALKTERDLVLGPSTDGGYYLIGMTGKGVDVFREVPWGTGDVLSATLDRVKEAGVSLEILEPWYDIDHPQDLAFLKVHLDLMERAGLTGGETTRQAIKELNLG